MPPMDMPPFELFRDIIHIIAVPVTIFGLKVLWNISQLVRTMHQTLYGETGTNGLRADVKHINSVVTELNYRVKAMEGK